MAVDKSYGSGKSRSAANSTARRRAAEGKMTKGKKGIASKIKAANTARANSPLGQIADTLLGFALPVGKVKAASRAMMAAGKVIQADALASRIAAKNIGKLRGENIAQGLPGGLPKIGNYARGNSESLFPRSTYGTPKSIRNLTEEGAKSASKSMGQAASREIATGRALRGVPGERERSMRNFAEARVNIRSAKELKKAAKNKGGR